jgi:predicted transcriptional regulator of viral defense system
MKNTNKLSEINTQLLNQLTQILASHNAPAISTYELARHTYFHAKKLGIKFANFKTIFRGLCTQLIDISLLSEIQPISESKGYLLFGQNKASPAEIICSLDPFAYISHLSAMEYHGLTDRFPAILYATRPSLAEWKQQAQIRMTRDLHEDQAPYLVAGLPKLTPTKIARLNQTPIHFCERSQLGAFRLVSGSNLRVATIGRTFLEMIREPTLCGGLQHVVDVYSAEAKRYLRPIIDEIDRHGLPIDKVRAGYLLTEVCQLDAQEFQEWQKLAQRGGSRKLDPDGEYATAFSERWKLSINLPSLTTPITQDE